MEPPASPTDRKIRFGTKTIKKNTPATAQLDSFSDGFQRAAANIFKPKTTHREPILGCRRSHSNHFPQDVSSQPPLHEEPLRHSLRYDVAPNGSTAFATIIDGDTMPFKLSPSNADRSKLWHHGSASKSLAAVFEVLPDAAGVAAERYISGQRSALLPPIRSRQSNPFGLVTSRDQPLAAKLVADGK